MRRITMTLTAALAFTGCATVPQAVTEPPCKYATDEKWEGMEITLPDKYIDHKYRYAKIHYRGVDYIPGDQLAGRLARIMCHEHVPDATVGMGSVYALDVQGIDKTVYVDRRNVIGVIRDARRHKEAHEAAESLRALVGQTLWSKPGNIYSPMDDKSWSRRLVR